MNTAMRADDSLGIDYLSITEYDIPSLPEQEGVPFWEKQWITSELKALLFEQPDAEQSLNIYLVVDANLRKGITGFFDLDNIDVPVKCLFTGDVAEELKEVAPYLIDLTLSDDALNNRDKTPSFHRDFFENYWDKGTGIIIHTIASMEKLHYHLRKFTKIQDEQGKWYFFRFWDPETVRYFLCACSEEEIETFLPNHLALKIYSFHKSYGYFSLSKTQIISANEK